MADRAGKVDRVQIEFDGSCMGNQHGAASRRAGYGVTIEDGGETVDELSGTVKANHEVGPAKVTNNVAEYTALINALRYVRDNYSDTPVTICGDSQLIVRQVNGEWDTNEEHLKRLRDTAQDMMEGTKVTLEWMSRDENERADELAKQATKLY
jgi:ribonuclease HI